MTKPALLKELDPETQKKVLRKVGRRRKPRETTFPAELVRRYSLRILGGEIAALTQDQRRRVLEQAIKANRV